MIEKNRIGLGWFFIIWVFVSIGIVIGMIPLVVCIQRLFFGG